MYGQSRRQEVPLTNNGKWNQDLYYKNYWGRLVPVEKRTLAPAEKKRKEKAKRAKKARKINQAYNRLSAQQVKRRKKNKAAHGKF